MVLNAVSAMGFNDTESALTKEMNKEMTEEEKDNIDKLGDTLKENIDSLVTGDKISVYEGVDRDMFDGGVAVTSTAKSFSREDGSGWVDALVKGGFKSPVAIALAASTAVFGAAAIPVAIYASNVKKCIMEVEYKRLKIGVLTYSSDADNYNNAAMVLRGSGLDVADIDAGVGHGKVIRVYNEEIRGLYEDTRIYDIDLSKSISEQSKLGKKELYNNAFNRPESKYARMIHYLEVGLTVAFVVLSVVDITLTGIALYKYYNVEHLPIPHHMVDTSYSETDETSFVNYRAVRDQDDNCGDVNGGGGKQWLALYQTKEMGAGDPILAPENGEAYEIVVKNADDKAPAEEYSPLHMFGTPNVAQNLTYADGDEGYSYNDPNGGTYLFFRRDTGEALTDIEDESENKEGKSVSGEAVSGSASDGYVGTAMNSGTILLSAAVGAVAGIFIGVVGTKFSRKKRKTGESE